MGHTSHGSSKGILSPMLQKAESLSTLNRTSETMFTPLCTLKSTPWLKALHCIVILPEELGSVMPCGNDQSQGPPEGILQRSPKQQDISQFSNSKPGALASFLSKSHVKLFAISLHNNFVVQLSEWKVNSAVPDVLPVSPVILMERQESWDGSVQFMVSVGLPHISPLLKLGAHSWHSMAKAVKEKKWN